MDGPTDPRKPPTDPRIVIPTDPRLAPVDPRITPVDPRLPAEKVPEKTEIPTDPRKPPIEKPVVKAPENVEKSVKSSESAVKPAVKPGKPLKPIAKKPGKVLTKAEIAERIERSKKVLNKFIPSAKPEKDETTEKVEKVAKQKTPQIKIVPLGAGQDVGRSCILITIGGKNIMVDCGMHMGYQDDRRFPDFSYIGGGGRLTDYLDCVIISHFHLDHCGSLPHMSEIVGYDGPIYMTYPTKAICPVLLEDYRKVQCDIKGETNFFTSDNIKNSMKKVIGCALHEIIQVDDQLSIRAFYAGHVLGAAMFEIRVGDQSVLYTGDYNMTPDRHLGAARVLPGVRPTLLISESTYATTIRDSKRARERDFLRKVHEAVMKGGKVIIPVFALGRAQELCILLESYWERMALTVPIYFSQGLAERANQYYRLFISWTNENIKNTFVERNMFEFKHIRPMEKGCEDQPGPQVLFSTPGMLHGGQSLKVFKKWCSDPINMIIMPGYCVAGTVGARVINGEKRIEIDGKMHDIRLGVEYMSFSAHADAKGIMHLIRQCEPKHVMFVHGEAEKMEFLKGKVEKEYGVPVHMPANGETVVIDTEPTLDIQVPLERIDRSMDLDPNPAKRDCPFLADIVFDQETETISIMPTIESEKLIETDECMPISLSFSEIMRIGKINWEKLAGHLLLFDPNLQHKDDGIEMFHGEITFLANNEEETELEATWDECRDHWFSVVRNSIFETFPPGPTPERSASSMDM